MKQAFAVFFVLSLPVLLSAQPVIDQADAPQVDDIFPYVTGTYQPITTSGPDALWDLSGIGTSEVTNFPCESPGATGYGDQYPTATLALDGGSTITFMRDDATGLYLVGIYKDLGVASIQIHYTDESLMLPYPCTYNTAYTDNFVYNYDYPGGTVNGGGNSTYIADGFGTLVLPYDTIYNVLKLSGIDSISESIPGTAYLTVSNQVYFYKPGLHYYLLSATELTQTVNGGAPQSGSGISYLSASAFAGIKGTADQAIGVEAWPNPAQDVLNVTYGIASGRSVDITLFDATGRSVRAEHAVTHASGIQRAEFDVNGLSAGVYLLQVSDDHDQRGTRQVVIQ